jgi:hypothetical protein
MKKMGTVDVMVYRQRETRIVKPKKAKLKRDIKVIPEKLIKGQAISYSVEYVLFPLFLNERGR